MRRNGPFQSPQCTLRRSKLSISTSSYGSYMMNSYPYSPIARARIMHPLSYYVTFHLFLYDSSFLRFKIIHMRPYHTMDFRTYRFTHTYTTSAFMTMFMPETFMRLSHDCTPACCTILSIMSTRFIHLLTQVSAGNNSDDYICLRLLLRHIACYSHLRCQTFNIWTTHTLRV